MPGYPSHWEADVVLSDGGTVHVRPITPEDADRLVALHARLSARTIHFRFFSPRPRLSARDVERFTVVDHDDRVALVALLGHDMIGVARYDRLPGTDEAEAAFVIEDAHQGRGLGTILLEHLAAAARERGVHRFVADVLPDNRKMLGVFRDAGWATSSRFEDGVVRVELGIEPTETSLAAQQRREARSESRSIERLLAPRSIAVVGASTDPEAVGHQVLRNLLQGGFAGPVYPVHPTAPSVASVRAYASVLDVPDDIDLAVIVVPADAVLGVVADCASKRVRGLVVISSGFREAGPQGAEAERALVHLARGSGMRVIGPNSMGLVNTDPAVAMNATIAGSPPRPGRVAFSSQSGALGIALLEWASRVGIGVSSFVSIGNKADVSTNDLLQFWEDDASTDAVLLYVESFGNPRKFARVARRVARRKPVVAVRGGRRLGADAHVDALFRQTGVVRVETLEQLFDVAAVLARAPLPAGRRVAVLSSTGGAGLLAADAAEGAGLTVGPLLDLPLAAGAEDYGAALDGLLRDDDVDAVLLVLTPPLRDRAEEVGASMADVAAAAGKPVVAALLAADGGVATVGPLPTVRTPEGAALALARAAGYAEWRRTPEGSVPAFDDVDTVAARLLVDAALAEGPRGVELGLEDAIELLDHFGIGVVPVATATTEDEAVAAADLVEGPVAVRAAFRALAGEAAAVTVQAAPPGGVAVVVGVQQDPSFGPLVSLAAGGPAADLLDDRASRITPLTDVDAASLTRALRISPRLLATGGTAGLEDLLLRVGRLVDDAPEISHLRLDPVVVTSSGAVVVGVEVRLAPWLPQPELALRRMREPA